MRCQCGNSTAWRSNREVVRAGAIRTYREDGSEWWRLLSRMAEYIEKKSAERDD